MKKFIVSVAAVLAAGSLFAQDTTSQKVDTIKVGNFTIIKKNKARSEHSSYDTTKDDNGNVIRISNRKRRKHSSINYGILDIGFANWRDETDYTQAVASGYLVNPAGKSDLKLRTGKTSNVNLWFFMQKINIAKHVLNLKYGLGLEMYNFRYESNISYHKTPAYIFRDTVSFEKNKLYAGYLTVPFMLNVNTMPDRKKGFSFSAGLSAGYLVGSHTKQVSDSRGKQKVKGDFDLDKWRVAAIGELGLGPVRIYGSYSFNALHERGLKQFPYAVGFRLSNW